VKQSDAFDRFDRASAELDATRFAIAHVVARWTEDPRVFATVREARVTLSELRRAAENLEMTFVLRLFSEFEGVLRDYWANGIGKRTEPEMRPLMNGIAARRHMNAGDLAGAHEIREYRNEIIHEGLRTPHFDVPECERAIGMYVRWLPLQW